jgi:EAL domain-containing protein (putative c-di-GMP-specific phosphodiesterase class I)
MKVHNTIFKDKVELKKFIEKRDIIDSKNTLLQIFSGIADRHYLELILKDIKSLLPNIKIIGSTTDGEIIDKKVTTSKTVLSFSIFKNTKIVTKYAISKDSNYTLGQELMKDMKSDDLKLLITFADGLKTNGETFIKVLEKEEPSLVVAGGLSGDNASFKKTYIFTEDGVYDRGAVGAFFYNKELQVHTEYNFGWHTLGKKFKVTKSIDNIVFTIDDEPAKTFYTKYLGKNILDRAIEFPFIIEKKDTKVARAILELRDDDSIVFSGNVKEGDIVSFGYGDINEILHKDISKFSKVDHKPVEGYFIYSCMARRRLFNKNIKEEFLPLSNSAPTSGFFTYGEFYHDKENHSNELLNQTTTILTIAEGEKCIKDLKPLKQTSKNVDKKFQTINILLNLISVTSKELNELNLKLTDKVREKTKELRYRYYHNSLTKLKNLNALQEKIKKETIFALSIFEIDNFLSLNEIYGLNATDKIIRGFAKQLDKLSTQKNFELYQISNKQFAIVVDVKYENYKQDLKYIQRNIKKYKIKIDGHNTYIRLDTTLGISTDHRFFIKTALIALYDAIKNKKTYSIFSIEMDNQSISKDILYWKNEIEHALKYDNIIPVFQPIVDKNQNIKKYEILMRLRHEIDEEEKLVSPFFFLETAHKTKLYPELTRRMIIKTFDIVSKNDQKFSINLSFEDILNKTTYKFLRNSIKNHNIGNKLIFEILESENVKDYEVVKNFIKEFRELGVEIAIDDFGAGFSNYMHIMEIEPDYLKIDGSLIKNIDKCDKSYKFVKSITNLAKSLDIEVVAEFVHSKEVFEVCKFLGIDSYQGFLFSPPLKEEELETFMISSTDNLTI